MGQLRAEVATLQAQATRLERSSAELVSRFTLAEQLGGTLQRRVGAIEVSLPNLIEAARNTEIGAQDITASIGGTGPAPYPAQGGSVAVQQTPLSPASAGGAGAQQSPMPPLLAGASATTTSATDTSVVGVALGPPVRDGAAALAAWKGIEGKVGALLLGLRPVLAESDGATPRRLVAGPLTARDASQLCGQLSRVGISCSPTPFGGMPLY